MYSNLVRTLVYYQEHRKNQRSTIYYLGRMTATGNAKEFVMENTTKTAVEIEWVLDTGTRRYL